MSAAAASALGTSALIVLMDWVPTALNRNILTTPAAARVPSTVVHTATGLAIAALHLKGRRRLALPGAVWYSAVLASAVNNWWLPYLLDVDLGEVDAATFTTEYAGNVTVLPRIGDHPVVPDLQHLLVHAGVALSCVLSWSTFASLPPRGARGRARPPASHPDARPPTHGRSDRVHTAQESR